MHPIQEKIYQIYKENSGKLPPYRNLAKTLGVASLNTVNYHINQLKKHGYFTEVLDKAMLPLSLATIINFSGKSGVYALFENETPFCIETTEDIKKSLLEKLKEETQNSLAEHLKKNVKKIFIAYTLIDDDQEKEDLKNYLLEFYKL